MKKFIDSLLSNLCIDPKIKDGMFDVCNKQHLEVLREHLYRKGFDRSFVEEYLNRIDDGKFPERQAYNREGYLVTFPNKEYKDQALKAGTHFNRNPKGPGTVWDDVIAARQKDIELRKKAVQPPVKADPKPSSTAPESTYEPKKPAPAPVPQQTAPKPAPKPVPPAAEPKPEAPVEEPKPVSKPTEPKPAPAPQQAPQPNDWRKDPNKTRQYALKLNWKENDGGDWFDHEGNFVAITTVDGYIKPVANGNRFNYTQWPPLPEQLNAPPPEVAKLPTTPSPSPAPKPVQPAPVPPAA